MRFLTPKEEAEKERKLKAARAMRNGREAMESVRFTGRMVFNGGQWCGIYGTPNNLKMRIGGEFFPVEEEFRTQQGAKR